MRATECSAVLWDFTGVPYKNPYTLPVSALSCDNLAVRRKIDVGPILIFGIAFAIAPVLSSYQNALTGKGLGCAGTGGYAIGIVAMSPIPLLPLLFMIWPKWILPRVQKSQLTVDLVAGEKIRKEYQGYIRVIFGLVLNCIN